MQNNFYTQPGGMPLRDSDVDKEEDEAQDF